MISLLLLLASCDLVGSRFLNRDYDITVDKLSSPAGIVYVYHLPGGVTCMTIGSNTGWSCLPPISANDGSQ